MTSILKVDEIQNTDGQSALVITPDGSLESVKFPEQSSPSGRVITSTTMSSYEEGTWVPTITNGTATNFANPSGIYTKIGSFVTITITVQLNDASPDLEISMPFKPKYHGQYTNQGFFLCSITDIAIKIDHTDYSLRFSNFNGSTLGSSFNGGVRATITYLTDE